MQVLIDTEVEILDKTIETELKKLVVYNDDVNTFDWVIDTLVEVCKHTSEQAEQCTIIIHFKGKCSVKEGELEELIEMRNEICRRGISAEIH
jgi:ATP-dependent Clp protease adaptor protein ClpS